MMRLEGRRQPLALFLNFLEVGKDAASADLGNFEIKFKPQGRGGSTSDHKYHPHQISEYS